MAHLAQDVWQPPRWLSVLSCGSVCRSCVTVIARLASTHTALVSQSLVGLCFAFPPINQIVNELSPSSCVPVLVPVRASPVPSVVRGSAYENSPRAQSVSCEGVRGKILFASHLC